MQADGCFCGESDAAHRTLAYIQSLIERLQENVKWKHIGKRVGMKVIMLIKDKTNLNLSKRKSKQIWRFS